MRQPLVISLCDLTGNAVRPWAEAGYECWCIDVQHPVRSTRIERLASGGSIHYAYGDARSWTPPPGRRIVFGFAFSPCTDVAGSGARDWQAKGIRQLPDALDLFNACHHALTWSGAPFKMENPVGALTRHFREPDYMFDPYEYAGYLDDPMPEAYTKRTCIWMGNGAIVPEKRPVVPVLGSKMHRLPPSADRANLRSATPAGWARAVFEANHQHALEIAA